MENLLQLYMHWNQCKVHKKILRGSHGGVTTFSLLISHYITYNHFDCKVTQSKSYCLQEWRTVLTHLLSASTLQKLCSVINHVCYRNSHFVMKKISSAWIVTKMICMKFFYIRHSSVKVTNLKKSSWKNFQQQKFWWHFFKWKFQNWN